MKHTIINPIAALLLLAVGLAGCSKEETLPDTPDNHGARLTISVTDGGYASADGARTRAVENGYATTFTAGDQIGMYAVVGNTIVAQNVCLTAADNGTGGVSWTGNAYYYEGVGAKYFAYYPYQSALNGTPEPSAADAAGFFADVTSQWSPATDQSTHAKYTACDLMVGNGSIGSKQDVSFTMTHAMALVVIETPTTKYILSTDANYTWTTPAPNTTFYGFTPYNPSVGTYRYLVKPTQNAANDLTGSYIGATGSTKEYTLPQNNLTAAKYAHYKVDGGSATIIEKIHTLQLGDFYMKDGSLVSKDATPTGDQKVACIGIVFKVGKDNSDLGDYKDMNSNAMSTIHGYVMALRDAGDGGELVWAAFNFVVGTSTSASDWQGYSNCQKMRGGGAGLDWSITDFPAANACLNFGTTYSKYAAPAGSSGWFLPSSGQLKHLHSNLLSGQIYKLLGTGNYDDIGWFRDNMYWSSSEDGSSPASSAQYVRFHTGSLSDCRKDYGYCGVRSVFAF